MFYRRLLLVLITLSKESCMYISAEEDSQTLSVIESNRIMKKIEMECKTAKKITTQLKKALNVRDVAEELGKRQWWNRRPLCDLKDTLTRLSV